MKLSINSDVIECFNKAINDEFNLRPGFGTPDFWNFVHSDMYMGLSKKYNSQYIDECFDALADPADAVFSDCSVRQQGYLI